MIDNKKISSYLLYAVGEVFLVMVGILGAVQIDNWNKQKEKRQTTDTYLRQIQEDLLSDIEEINAAAEYFYQKDSLIKLVFRNRFTVEDYRQNRGLISLVTNYNSIKVDRSGYDNLTKNFEQVPKGYQEVFALLKKTYEGDDQIESITTHMANNSLNNYNDIGEHFPFYYLNLVHRDSLLAHPSSNHLLDYLANDPVYKMKVGTYLLIFADYFRVTAQYRLRAALAYEAIDQLLQPNAPSKIEQYLIKQDSSNYRSILGRYAAETDTVEVMLENDQLFLTAPSFGSPKTLYQWADSSYTSAGFDRLYIKGDSIIQKLIGPSEKVYFKLNN